MKVSLVVASGAHQGKVISITGAQFLIGRDAQCHLRPASQAISKQHCGVMIRDGQVYIKDYGSTNGTLVNDELIKGAEARVDNGSSLKLGPLDFIVRIEVAVPQPDGTPLPVNSPESAAALAAVKAAAGALAAKKPSAASRDATPNPAQQRKVAAVGDKDLKNLSGSKEGVALTGSKEAAALKAASGKPAPEAVFDPEATLHGTTLSPPTGEEDDKMAAMLLGMDDESVPEGSTVVDFPAVDEKGNPLPAPTKPEEKKKVVAQTREEMSSAASDLLRKMMRRPK